MTVVAFKTPLGVQHEVDDEYLPALVEIIEHAHVHAYSLVIDLLDAEVAKSKDRGDFATAETIEMLRAKVKAKVLTEAA